MGRSVNKVTIVGTLGRDPEVNTLPNGNAVANLSIATDESYMDKSTGQKVEATEWHRVTVYAKVAEICGQYLKKGSKAYFEGKLRTREWEKDGIKRYTTEIIANDVMLLDGAKPQMGQEQQAPMQQAPMQQAPQQQAPMQQAPQQAPMQQAPQQQAPMQQAPMQQAPQQQAPQPSNNFDQFETDIPF